MIKPKHTVGYAGVVFPKTNFWQGFFIIDTPQAQAAADDVVMTSQSVNGTNFDLIEGVIHATLCEAVRLKNEPLVGASALALRNITNKNFFWVKGIDEGGWHTTLFDLKARSVEAARDEINNLPLVSLIKTKLITSMVTELVSYR